MNDNERALYIISVAAELAGVHPQTLRIYERKGLIEPKRTEGRSRRYSDRDIELLQHIQELTNEGVGLAGVKHILELEAALEDAAAEIESLRARMRKARRDIAEAEERVHLQAAQALARDQNHSQVTPEHLLAALVSQPEGVVLPVLERVGVPAKTVRDRVEEALQNLPKVYGQTAQQAQLSQDAYRILEAADQERTGLDDDYLSTEHVLLAMSEVTGGVGDLLRGLGVTHDTVLTALKDVRGSHRVTSENPEREPRGPVPGPRAVRARPHRRGPQGQARPGHRTRRGDPARHPGAVAPDQEQPGAHR